MLYRFKFCMSAFLIIAAICTAASSGALADNYTASMYPTTETGTSPAGNDTLTTEAGNIECAAHYEGTITASTGHKTVFVKTTECRAFGFLSATANMNECHYTYTTPTSTWAGLRSHTLVHYKCKGSSVVSVSAGSCEFTIGEQAPSGVVKFENNTASGDISMQAAVSGINYTVTKDGLGCPFSGTGAKTGATYIQHSPITVDSTNGANIHTG